MYLGMCMDGQDAAPPLPYLDMVLLPRLGYPYSEVKRMTLAEKFLLLKLLKVDFDHPIHRQKDT